jgi:hypothetical protein
MGILVALGLATFLITTPSSRMMGAFQTSKTNVAAYSVDASTPKGSLAVPFIFIRDSVDYVDPATGKLRYQRSIDSILYATISGYQKEISLALQGLSKMLEQALLLENNVMLGGFGTVSERIKQKDRLSTRIQTRIQRVATCLEHNERVVTQLLGSFYYTMALPDKEYLTHESTVCEDRNTGNKEMEYQWSSTSNMFQMMNLTQQKRPLFNARESESHSYDSAIQILAHLTRDWTKEGLKVRQSIYEWCCEQVERSRSKAKQGARILVPGAGMGRLAYDLSQMGHHVEANELSPSMAAAASAVLRDKVTGFLHPYLLDGLTNEVDANRRYDMAEFPDVEIQGNTASFASLSYTVGDFVGTQDDFYYLQRLGSFDAIVTCFFIDTAHNIYEYLGMLEVLLKPKVGIWVNVGPVQWHPNAILRPSVDELKDLMKDLGWKIQIWQVDHAPVSYRDTDDQFVRMTNYEGYRPLRFVALRS